MIYEIEPEQIEPQENHLTLEDCRTIFTQIRELENCEDKLSKLKYNDLIGKVIESVTGMIVKYANKYSGEDTIKYEDLILVGREAAYRAIKKYDPYDSREGKFSTLAKSWIVGAMKNQLREESLDGYKEVVNWQMYLDMANHIQNISLAFTCRMKRPPTFAELAGIMKIRTSTLIACVKIVDTKTKSLDNQVSDKDNSELHNLIPSDDLTPVEQSYRGDLRNKLDEVFKGLSTRELNTLCMRWGTSLGYKVSFEDTINTYDIPSKKWNTLKSELLREAKDDPEAGFSIAGFFESNRAVYTKPNADQKKALGIHHHKN